MKIDFNAFKSAYDQWVATYQADFEEGKTTEAVKNYPFVVSEDVPWTPFVGESSEKTVALVTSGGLYLKDSQPAFEPGTIHGDPSYRAIPRTVTPKDLAIAHGHYDTALAEQDINTIFPLQRFIELEKEGIIGRVADTHYSFSYVNDVVTLVRRTIPEVLGRLKAAAVDFLFLVPV